MLCSIQTHRHIDTSSMKFHIKHFMQSSCNCIHMFCLIQTHRHTDTCSHKKIIIKYVTHHLRSMLAHHLFSSSWCWGVHSPTVFCFIVPKGMQLKGLAEWCRGVCSPTVFHFIVPRGTHPNDLVAWCPGVRSPRIFSTFYIISKL
jgi:hypothetical protein